MSDLDKLMKKLKTEEPKAEEPKPELDDDEDEEDEDEEVSEEIDSKVSKEDTSEPIPANVEEEHSIEAEVGLLQNDGIFRRELLLIKKEQVDVLKIMAQTLLDIKKKLIGEDGEKN